MHAIVHAADIQDRDGGVFVMATMFGMYPFLMKLYADGGYQGPLFRRAVAKIMARVNVEIVKRSDHAKGFVVLPKRWWSNERSHGSGDAGVWPKIGRISTERHSHFCASLQSGSCSENYAILHDLSGQTLRAPETAQANERKLSTLRLLSTDMKYKERISELVGDLPAPVVARLQLAIDILENLSSNYGPRFPSGVLVRQLFTLKVGL